MGKETMLKLYITFLHAHRFSYSVVVGISWCNVRYEWEGKER